MDRCPLMVKLREKRTVVVGGGNMAHRRLQPLLQAKAAVTVVSPEAIAPVGELHRRGDLKWVRKRFEPKDIAGAFLIIAATDRPHVNCDVAAAASEAQLLNVVDRPELGNVTMPGVVNRGRLTIAVSTGGASPFLARRIREEIAESYDESYEEYLEFLWACRNEMRKQRLSRGEREKRLKRLLEPQYRRPENRRELLRAPAEDDRDDVWEPFGKL